MKINEALKEIMKTQRVTQARMAQIIKAKSQSVVAERLKKGETMQMDKAIEMLEALGYEMVIQPKSTRGKRAAGAYVIDMGDKEE